MDGKVKQRVLTLCLNTKHVTAAEWINTGVDIDCEARDDEPTSCPGNNICGFGRVDSS